MQAIVHCFYSHSPLVIYFGDMSGLSFGAKSLQTNGASALYADSWNCIIRHVDRTILVIPCKRKIPKKKRERRIRKKEKRKTKEKKKERKGRPHATYTLTFDIFPRRCNITQFIYFWKTNLHVSGGISTHHQEHTTVFTASGTCQTVTATCRYCERVGTGLRYCKYSCVCSWWWAEIPPETCRAVFQK